MSYAIGYIRVSTEGQADKFGIDAQKRIIFDYASMNGYDIVDFYVDVISGVKDDRPEFNKIAYDDVLDEKIDTIIVAKMDRLARDINVYFYYKMLLRKKEIKLVSANEDFGQFGQFAPMLESFIICVADMERKNITLRTMSGRKLKASKGGFAGGKPPYGYKNHDKQLIIDEYEANGVRMIFDLRKQGFTIRNIVNKLYEKGYKNNKGNPFSTSRVKLILDSEKLYRGYYKWGDSEWIKGEHEPILY